MAFSLAELAEVVAIAMDTEDVPELTPDVDLYNEIGMDSMSAVIMVVEVQRRTGVVLENEMIPQLRTPQQLLDAITPSPRTPANA